MEEYTAEKDAKITWKTIILEHIRKILELRRVEFKGGYNVMVESQSFYIPDTRQPYINAVDGLSDVLLPFFDKKMNDENKKILEGIEKIMHMECHKREIQVEKNWKKMVNTFDSTTNENYKESRGKAYRLELSIAQNSDLNNLQLLISKEELKLRRKLFQQLSLLLNRVDYLKTTLFSEEETPTSDIVEIDEVET